MVELTDLTAVETAKTIAKGDASVVEVTDAHISRLDAVGGSLNAVVEPMADSASSQARSMDNNRPKDLPPFWGVPITIKINVDLTGFPNSNGIPALNKTPATADSPVVANLKAAGGVILGRTSTPEFSLRFFTSNPIYGVTRNPWDKDIGPGGSSGGASAAVAAGLGCLGHGNDLGGSLRYPAYACGLATLRPSLGRVPAFNPSAAAERPATLAAMSVQGVIARSVEDVRAALPVLSQGDWRDVYWRPAPTTKPVRTVGYCVDPFGDGVDADVARAVTAAVDAAKSAGLEVVEVQPPRVHEIAQTWGELLNAEVEYSLVPMAQEHGSDKINRLLKTYGEIFGTPGRDGFIAALAQRNALRRAWAEMFQSVDAVILPVSAQVPFRLEQDFEEPETVPDIMRALRVLYMVNLLGLPGATVRTLDSAPVPLGVQIVGPEMGDETCLEVAAQIERSLAFDLRPIDPRF